MMPLASIIVPTYNSCSFLRDTLKSVLAQSYKNIEIIVVDDGSTDDTSQMINGLIGSGKSHIQYVNQANAGVSAARNRGLKKASGTFVLFLDSDDILGEDFVEVRINAMLSDPEAGFCCSHVIKIDAKGKRISQKVWKGAAKNVLEEVLSFNTNIITCPSNYLVRKKILDDYSISFKTDLSSSADRYFLIELSQVSRGILLNNSYLYYRMHAKSMSHFFSESLLEDNLRFQQKILALPAVTGPVRRTFIFKTNYICAGSYLKLRKFVPCVIFSIKALAMNPVGFVKQLVFN
jgi:glycosyltransferase involved in cell wall biosynthesis